MAVSADLYDRDESLLDENDVPIDDWSILAHMFILWVIVVLLYAVVIINLVYDDYFVIV